ncbi:MAG: pyruvate kinase, partial [Rhodospirillaceae bacterium]
MRRDRCAKILATLGPATATEAKLESLVRAGADVVRMNFSHGTYDDHRKRYDLIRSLESKVERPIGILVDLQGPKLRVGKFIGGSIKLNTGAMFRLDQDSELGTVDRVCLPHPELFSALDPGTDLLLDDGKLRLRVESLDGTTAVTRVITGGT